MQECNFYVRNLEDGINDKSPRREFSLLGTVASARVMMEAGHSKDFGFALHFLRNLKSYHGMNGRIVITKPLHLAVAQSEEEH